MVQRCYEEALALSISNGMCRVSALAKVLMKYGSTVGEVSLLLRSVYRSDIPEDEVTDCCNGIVSTPWNVNIKDCISPFLSEVMETVMSTFSDYPEDVQLLYGRQLVPVDVPARYSIVTTRGWEFLRVGIDGETVLGISEYVEDMPASVVSRIIATMLCIQPGIDSHDDLMHHPSFHDTLSWTTGHEYLRASTGRGGRMLYDPRGRPMPFRVHDVRDLSAVFDGILFAWSDSEVPFTVIPAADLVLFGHILDDEGISDASFMDLARILSNFILCQQSHVRMEVTVRGIGRLERELSAMGVTERLWEVDGETVILHPEPIIPPVRGVPRFRELLS